MPRSFYFSNQGRVWALIRAAIVVSRDTRDDVWIDHVASDYSERIMRLFDPDASATLAALMADWFEIGEFSADGSHGILRVPIEYIRDAERALGKQPRIDPAAPPVQP